MVYNEHYLIQHTMRKLHVIKFYLMSVYMTSLKVLLLLYLLGEWCSQPSR